MAMDDRYVERKMNSKVVDILFGAKTRDGYMLRQDVSRWAVSRTRNNQWRAYLGLDTQVPLNPADPVDSVVDRG